MSTRARSVAPRLIPALSASVVYRLPSEARSVGWTRKELRRHLRQWGISDELAYSAELVVSELVTNAVRAQATAGGAWIGVGFAVGAGGRLRLEVRGASHEQPVV